jgi:hypothetical protein
MKLTAVIRGSSNLFIVIAFESEVAQSHGILEIRPRKKYHFKPAKNYWAILIYLGRGEISKPAKYALLVDSLDSHNRGRVTRPYMNPAAKIKNTQLCSHFFAASSTTTIQHKSTQFLVMASVYKSVFKTGTKTPKDEEGTKKNKQRVLVLTSRGVTYRCV